MNDVVVVTGVRGLGLACARRLGVGKQLLLADNNPETLAAPRRNSRTMATRCCPPWSTSPTQIP